MTTRIPCPDCARTFVDDNALAQHRRWKHGQRRPRSARDDDEESIADIAVGAELKLAMGVPLDEFEASLVS